jgi:hypothetical protein
MSRLAKLVREPVKLGKAPAMSLLRYVFKLKRMLGKRGDTIFLASVPKCGSTFLVNALVAVTGYPMTGLCYGRERQEQDLYYPRLVDAYGRDTVTRHHTRATVPNLQLMRMFSIRPVIVVRNFLDVVPSIHDHLYKTNFRFPFLYANDRFPELDEKAQIDFIIETGLPWYFHFYVAWFDACASGETEALWITFEEMVADWTGTLRRILEFHGLERTDAQIGRALEQTRGLGADALRLNKGKVGRGKLKLTEAQRQKILDLARYYPWVDFSRVGIPSATAPQTPPPASGGEARTGANPDSRVPGRGGSTRLVPERS